MTCENHQENSCTFVPSSCKVSEVSQITFFLLELEILLQKYYVQNCPLLSLSMTINVPCYFGIFEAFAKFFVKNVHFFHTDYQKICSTFMESKEYFIVILTETDPKSNYCQC